MNASSRRNDKRVQVAFMLTRRDFDINITVTRILRRVRSHLVVTGFALRRSTEPRVEMLHPMGFVEMMVHPGLDP